MRDNVRSMEFRSFLYNNFNAFTVKFDKFMVNGSWRYHVRYPLSLYISILFRTPLPYNFIIMRQTY